MNLIFVVLAIVLFILTGIDIIEHNAGLSFGLASLAAGHLALNFRVG